jgi:A/G-specific adenine glycosylase
MLQQTQVATVIDYYRRFLAAYPDVCSLAAAEEQDVLRLWSGLGYYRRARQMHAAAIQIATADGQFPSTADEIETLPGIGRYTAGAIASFAFDQPAPIVEANTQRLFSRLLRLEVDPRSPSGQLQLWAFAQSLVDTKKYSPARINQAVMEIGSQVCTPRNPDCPRCPLGHLCPTYADGLQATIPAVAPKKTVTELTHVAFIIRHCDQLLMVQNPADQWWTGLWDFPRVDVSHSTNFRNKTMAVSLLSSLDLEWLASQMHQQHGIDCNVGGHHGTFKHTVTRYRITLHTFNASIGKRSKRNSAHAWHPLPSALDLPLTAPARKILKGFASAAE